MKIKLTFIALLSSAILILCAAQRGEQAILTQVASGGGGTISGCSGPPSDTGSSGCLVRETFEGATLCFATYTSNCQQAWYYVQSSVTFNYSTAPAPLQGSNSLYVPDGTIPVAALGFTAGATIYAGAMININTYTLNNAYDVLNVETSNLTPLCILRFNTFSPNELQVSNSGGSTGSSSTISGGWVNGTTYYVKLEAVVGSGANAACTAQLSTDGATWGYTATSTNGTWTTNTGYVEFDQTGTAAINEIVDDVRASTSTFNYW